VAQRDRYPSFQLSGSIGTQATTLSALSGGGSTASALLASISAPLFDAGGRRAQVGVQEAALDQAHEDYRAAVLGALREVEDSLVALDGDQRQLDYLRNAAEAAGNAWLLAQQQYASGLIDFQVVLDVQRTLLSTQDAVATAAAQLTIDRIRLYKALGGGWQPDDAFGEGS
jgi:outer membrane protein TolC